MSNNHLKQDITILLTWDDEKFELELSYEKFIETQNAAKARGEDGINLSKYKRFIKFSNIKDISGKTKYLQLAPPKKEKKLYELGSVERIRLQEKNPKKYNKLLKEDEERRAKIQRLIMENLDTTQESRVKRFILERNEILEGLRKKEAKLGLQTTVDKLDEYQKIKNKKLKKQLGE